MENPFELLEQNLTRIESKIDEIIQQINNPDESSNLTWYTTKQLANHLGVSASTITKLRGTKLPYYKVGGRVLFKKQEIDEFIIKTRHKTGGEYLQEYLSNSNR